MDEMQYQDNLWMARCKYCCSYQLGYSAPHLAPSLGSSSGMVGISAYAKRKIISWRTIITITLEDSNALLNFRKK